MKLSIIIPIYNVERYLERCVDSILNQENIHRYLNNLEILLINDGSPDNSQEIIEEYVANYSFIKGFTKENGGLSSARNFGLEQASGTHIWFIDSDDWIESNALDIVFNEIEKNDLEILEFDWIKYSDDKGQISSEKDIFFSSIKTDVIAGDYFLEDYGYIMCSCTKIAKRSIYLDNALFFPAGELNEDNLISLYLLHNASRYKKINSPLYYYYTRLDSITTTLNIDKRKKLLKDLMTNVLKVREIIDNQSLSLNSYSKLAEVNSFVVVNILIAVIKLKDPSYYEEVIAYFKKIGEYPVKPYKYHNTSLRRKFVNLFFRKKWMTDIFRKIIA